jgi:type IV secretory pathway VirB9-like protein
MRVLVPLSTLLVVLAVVPALAQPTPVIPPTPPAKSSLSLTARSVSYAPTEVVPLRAQLRYTTLIVLPAGEQILDVTCGDKEVWLVNASQNLCYVKPARAGAQTNLNLLTATGTVYSFALMEVSGSPGVAPDLKVFVEAKDQALRPTGEVRPVFVPVQQVVEYQHQVEAARLEVTRATERARTAEEAGRLAQKEAETRIQQETTAFRAAYPHSLRFPYAFTRSAPPFRVTAIFHDGLRTFIRADPPEVPALYELKDGKASLVQFDFRDGLYVVGKVLDQAYLALGATRFYFLRQER